MNIKGSHRTRTDLHTGIYSRTAIRDVGDECETSRTGRSGGTQLVCDVELQLRQLIIRGKVVGQTVLGRIVGGGHHQSLGTGHVSLMFGSWK